MRVLLTGGLGFIGSHTAVTLLKQGYEPVVYDNLSNASPDVAAAIGKITGTTPRFIQGDIRDKELLRQILREEKIAAVIHFAGLKAVGESCAQPLKYYDNNVGGTITLLEAMQECGVKHILFSSSSTVYGNPKSLPLTEESPVGGVTNPYGRTKLIIEKILADLCAADPQWSAICLRYFNPIGADPSGLIGENPNGIPNNLLPYVARVAAGLLPYVRIFGHDYNTADGTGVRDYIHVCDLAEGHAAALPYLLQHTGWEAINLGTGTGYSVLEIIHAFEAACGHSIAYRFLPRRDGDIAANWANADKAKRLLHWSAKRNLAQMCRDVWHFEEQRRSHS